MAMVISKIQVSGKRSRAILALLFQANITYRSTQESLSPAPWVLTVFVYVASFSTKYAKIGVEEQRTCFFSFL